MIFGRKNKTRTEPKVIEIKLKKDYRFMYENFLISKQQELYLMLEENDGIIDLLKFNFTVYKYGYPNDEAMGSHPMAKFGLGFYGLFEVLNSPWIKEVCEGNRIHPRHDDSMFNGSKHYIVRFKDVTLDVLCNKMEETQLTREQIFEIVSKEIEFIKTDN
jgi:hypothetical protein